jgi:hypothetical protein
MGWIRWLVVALAAARLADGASDADRERYAEYVKTHPVIVYVAGCQWKNVEAPGPEADPVDALGEGDEAVLAKPLTPVLVASFIDRYVDRIEAYYATAVTVPPAFAEWLKAHPAIRKEFWLAISPRYDDAGKVVAILDELRARDAKRCEKFFHLAIALAVVWDCPDAVASSRYAAIWGYQESQFPQLRGHLDVWDYFTDDRVQPRLLFKPTALPWPFLVHLADLDVTAEDVDWVQKSMESNKKDLAGLYPLVPYDYGKLAQTGTKFGDRSYTLPNLLSCGGVCGDQAHFMSRVAKCFGVPAMKVTGEGRYGGAGHAWAGFLIAAGGRPVLDFTGRYFFDYYYTGDVFDPQTRTSILDRTVAMLYDGASLSYAKYVESQALARVAMRIAEDKPEASLALAKEAIKRNYYCGAAWKLLMRHIAKGRLAQKEREAYCNQMMKDLAAHPDLTLECLGTFIECIPASDTDKRQALYTNALKLYGKRPDLQIRLRMLQGRELMEAHREPDALRVSLETVIANAKEGSLILPLVHQVVEQAKFFAASAPTFRLDVVKAALKKAELDFPKSRGSAVSEAYLDFQKLVGSL